MSSYATLQDAYGIPSFTAPVTDEMNGNAHEYFDARPVITEAMHNVYGDIHREDMENEEYAPAPRREQKRDRIHAVEKMENAHKPSLKRRTTEKRHDVEHFQPDLTAFLQQLPPAQREVLTAAFVGGAVYVLLSLLD